MSSPKKKCYDGNMEKAIAAVKSGSLSQAKAAKKFRVPQSTLNNRLTGKHSRPYGGQTKFTMQEEEILADLLIWSGKCGIPLTLKMFRGLVQRYAAEKGINYKMSNRWKQGFMQRHPSVSACFTRSKVPKGSTEESLKQQSFETFIIKLKGLKKDGYLDDPNGIWNIAEAEYLLTEAVTKRNLKRNFSTLEEEDSDRLTIVACGNAAGKLLNPLLFYGEVPKSADEDESESFGEKVFAPYMNSHALPEMTANKNVVFISGNHSLIDEVQLVMCAQSSGKDIKILILPAGKLCSFEPVEKAAFALLRRRWNGFVRKSANDSPDLTVCKEQFLETLSSVCNDWNLSPNLKTGFRKIGIFPYDNETVCENLSVSSHCDPIEEPNAAEDSNDSHKEDLNQIRQILLKTGLAEDVIESHLFSIQCSLNGKAGRDLAFVLRDSLAGSSKNSGTNLGPSTNHNLAAIPAGSKAYILLLTPNRTEDS